MDTIRNPKTGKMIKIGGVTHRQLICQGILERTTFDIGKKSIVDDSRQKMPYVILEHHDKTTHWVNCKEISDALHISQFTLIEWTSKEFQSLKICISQKNTRIIFPTNEFFIQNIVDDFIKDYSKKHNLDITYWNQ